MSHLRMGSSVGLVMKSCQLCLRKKRAKRQEFYQRLCPCSLYIRILKSEIKFISELCINNDFQSAVIAQQGKFLSSMLFFPGRGILFSLKIEKQGRFDHIRYPPYEIFGA
jgi:hypothetical protein